MTIVEAKRTQTPHYGMTAYGYTKKSGAPTSIKVRLLGEKRRRRLMCWQFSNAGTLFLKIMGKNVIVQEYELPVIP